MSLAAIWKTIFPLLSAIGRWVMDRVRRVGALQVGAYMIERAQSVFRRRLRNVDKVRRTAKSRERRRRWLRGRIRRWLKLGTWLVEHARAADRVKADLLKLARQHRVPIVGDGEVEPR